MCTRGPPDIGPRLSPSWTSWTRTSSRVDGDSSTRTTEVSASWTRTERRSGEESRGKHAWSPAKRNIRVSPASVQHTLASYLYHLSTFFFHYIILLLFYYCSVISIFTMSVFFLCITNKTLKLWVLFYVYNYYVIISTKSFLWRL